MLIGAGRPGVYPLVKGEENAYVQPLHSLAPVISVQGSDSSVKERE